MAAGELLSRVLPHLRRLSTAAAGDLKLSPDSSLSVIHFLRGRGLGDEVLAGFDPRLLDANVGKDLPAKFDHLLARGFSVREAAKVLRYNGLLHNVSLVSLRERLDALRGMVSDDAHLPRIINRAPWTLYSSRKIKQMVDNVSKVRGWGVSDAKIRSFFVCKPRFFQLEPHCVDDAADRAEALGVPRDSKKFVYAVKVLYGMRESTRQSKFRVFQSLGWDRSSVIALFKNFPDCFNQAEATLVKKLGFLMNQVGYDPPFITKNPVMLGYSLEKRVRPRYELLNDLKSKKLLPKAHAFYPTWTISEAEFMEKYVVKFMKEEPSICNAYINTVASPKPQASSGFVFK